MAPSISLFSNEREANLESMLALSEDVLIELGYFVNDCRCDRPGSAHAWDLKRGNSSMTIDLVEHPDGYRVRIAAKVLVVDETVDTLGLFRALLSLNAVEVTRAAFALQDQQVLLLAEHGTVDLDRAGLRELICLVRRFASDYDAKLIEQFGGSQGRSPSS